MNFDEALTEAKREARANRLPLVVVLLGIHRDDHEPEDAHGYCPVAAKETLYPYGVAVATVSPNGRIEYPAICDVILSTVRTFCGNSLRESDPTKWLLVEGKAETLVRALVENISSASARNQHKLVNVVAERLASAYWSGRLVEPGKFQSEAQRDEIAAAASRDIDVWRPVAKSTLGI